MNTPTVLITGALTGIGRATALAFGREGARGRCFRSTRR
jgi:NAD(P)-dependent dehydrogenase (short-subunit alcohol dehydrogenase family)